MSTFSNTECINQAAQVVPDREYFLFQNGIPRWLVASCLVCYLNLLSHFHFGLFFIYTANYLSKCLFVCFVF